MGYLAYRLVFDLGDRVDAFDDPVDPRALHRGLPIVMFVLAGFTLGDVIGVPAWVIAALAAGWASVLVERLPWRTVPLGAIAIAGSLAVVVAAAAPHLPLDRLFATPGTGGAIGSIASATVLSNATNNLPTVLAGSAVISDPTTAWPLLAGANIGSVLIVSGSLSTLLWRDTARRYGVEVTARRWTRVALPIGAPALIAATSALLLW